MQCFWGSRSIKLTSCQSGLACTVQKLKFDFVKAWYPYRARASCMQRWKQQLNFRLCQYLCFCQLTKVLRLLRLLPVLAPWIPRYPVKHIYQIFTWFSKDSQTFFYLGIIWVGISLARFWYVLGCLLWHMTRLKFLLNFSPNARESEFRKLGNFCEWNPKSWALESGIQLKESEIQLSIETQNLSSTDKILK